MRSPAQLYLKLQPSSPSNVASNHSAVRLIRIPTPSQARQQAKEMLWMRQSENMVLEAMTRLSAVHDALEEMGAATLTTLPGLQSRSNSITSSFTRPTRR